MAQKKIATLLVLSAFAIAGANSASADGGGFRGGVSHDGNGGFHGRGFHKRSSPVVVGGYGSVGSDGYADNNGSGNGSGDWYGISSGHDECPLFRKRVMTPDGWRIQMVPVC
jgi:hypothetical protein